MPDGVGEVQDFMPPARTGEAAHRHRMIRRVLAVRGRMRLVVDVAPRFDYARARHDVALTAHGALFRTPGLGLSLSTRCPLAIIDGRDVCGRIELRASAARVREDAHLREPRRAVLGGDRADGEQLGNFPQAFTHLALISAAYNLERELG